jgi:mRNA interferase MazF
VAPITGTIRGIWTEVTLRTDIGLGIPSVARWDNLTTIPKSVLGEQIGILLDRQESLLSQAMSAAFDLD